MYLAAPPCWACSDHRPSEHKASRKVGRRHLRCPFSIDFRCARFPWYSSVWTLKKKQHWLLGVQKRFESVSDVCHLSQPSDFSDPAVNSVDFHPGSDRLYAKLAMSTISGALWHWLYTVKPGGQPPYPSLPSGWSLLWKPWPIYRWFSQL